MLLNDSTTYLVDHLITPDPNMPAPIMPKHIVPASNTYHSQLHNQATSFSNGTCFHQLTIAQ